MQDVQLMRSMFSGFAVQKALPVFESMDLAIKKGATHFYVEGSSKEDNALRWDNDKLSRVKDYMKEHNLSAIYHGNYRNPIANEIYSIREAAVDYAKREVDVAAALGAPLIVHGSCIFTHKNMVPLLKSANIDFAECVNQIAEYASLHGVELWLENLEYYRNKHPFHTVFSKNEDYREVFSRVCNSVRFIIDIGHENISSGKPEEIFREHMDRVVAISVSDNDGMRDSHSDLGSGNLDFSRLVKEIMEVGWRGYLTVETRSGDLAASLDYLEGLTHDARGEERGCGEGFPA